MMKCKVTNIEKKLFEAKIMAEKYKYNTKYADY